MGLIGDIYYSFRGDGARLQKDAKVEGAKAGAGLGKSAAASFKSSWSGANVGKGLVQGLGLAGGLGAALVVSRAISGVVDLLGDATQAAIEDEASIQKLNTALKDNIPNWNGETKAIERVLEQRIALGYSDDEQRASLATLAASTKDVTKALDLERGAMDISRARGIDLASASDAVAKAFAGNTKGLKSMLPGLKLGATTAETLANAFAMVKGQAEDYTKTMGGKMLVAQTKINEAMEKIGYSIAPAVASALEGVSTAIHLVTGSSAALGGISDSIANEIAAGNREGLEKSKAAIEKAMGDLKSNPFLFFVSGSQIKDLEGQLAAVDKALDSTTLGVIAKANRMDAETSKSLGPDGVGGTLDQVGDDGVTMSQRVSNAMGDVEDASAHMAENLAKDAQSMISDAFDPIIERDQLVASNAEAAAARRVIASKTASTAEKADAYSTLHTTEKAIADHLTALAKAGQTNSKAYKDGMASLKSFAKTQGGETKRELDAVIAKIEEVERAGKTVPINVAVSYFTKAKIKQLEGAGLAEGGPVRAGQPYVVGEKRPELFVPNSNGRIVPRVPSAYAAPSGGSTNLTVNLTAPRDGSVVAARRFGQAVLDVVADGLREQTARLG